MSRSGYAEQGDGLDYSERAGFLVGKSAAMADSAFRREQREFERLCARLAKRKWWASLPPEHKARVYERIRAWVKAHPEKRRAAVARYLSKPGVRARQVAKDKARRRARILAEQDATVRTCPGCGVKYCWYRAPWIRGLRAKFCTEACRDRAKYVAQRPGAVRRFRKPRKWCRP